MWDLTLTLATTIDSWETFRMSLSNSAVDGVLLMDMVKSSILNEEMRRISQDSSSQSEMLVAESRGRNKNWYSGNRGKGRSYSKNRYTNVECYNCGKKGHFQKDCRLSKKEDKDKGKEDDSDVESSHLILDDLLLVEEHGMSNVIDSSSSWVIDSGTSVHVTSRRYIFGSYISGEFGDVKLAHEGVLKCIGLGDVNLEMANGSKLTLKDVKHVPDIRLNLLSVAKLCDEGYNNLFSRDTWKLTKGSMVVARGRKCSTLYVADAKIIKNVHAIKSTEKVELWHKRLCHMS